MGSACRTHSRGTGAGWRIMAGMVSKSRAVHAEEGHRTGPLRASQRGTRKPTKIAAGRRRCQFRMGNLSRGSGRCHWHCLEELVPRKNEPESGAAFLRGLDAHIAMVRQRDGAMARTISAIMSLIQSTSLNGHDLYACIKDVLARLPTHRHATSTYCCRIAGPLKLDGAGVVRVKRLLSCCLPLCARRSGSAPSGNEFTAAIDRA